MKNMPAFLSFAAIYVAKLQQCIAPYRAARLSAAGPEPCGTAHTAGIAMFIGHEAGVHDI
jgi:hypothetical protein